MKLFFFFYISLLLTVLNASEIKWEKDFSSGLSKAKNLNKPLMFIISNHNCRFCIQYEKNTLKDSKVIENLNKDFINVIVYVDENPTYPRQLDIPGTPGTWFIKNNGDPMFEVVMGSIDSSNFLKALEVVKKEYKKNLKK